MASISNTLITSYDYLLRNCYSTNRNARKAITRTNLKQNELAQADSSALKKIANNLRHLEYDDKNAKNVYNNVKVFVDSYNNLLDSGDKTSSAQLDRNTKKLKDFIKKNKDELKKLGLNVSSSGKITVKNSKLTSTSASKIGELFSSSGSFTSTVAQLATKINRYARTLQSNPAKTDDTDVLPPVDTESIMTDTTIDYKA